MLLTIRPRAALGLALCVAALPGCGHAYSSVKSAAAAEVSVPGADRFAPFITEVPHGSQVTFYNGDRDAHTVVSVPGDALALHLLLKPGQRATVTVDASGIHRFYCSIHAHYDAKTGQIAANPNADHPDEPMEGVIAVPARSG